MCRYDGFELFNDIDSYVRSTCTQKTKCYKNIMVNKDKKY